MLRHFLASLAIVAAPKIAAAQYLAPASTPTAAQCTAASDTLSLGALTNVAGQLQARSVIGGCTSVAGSAIASAMNRRRSSSLSDELNAVFAVTNLDTAIMRQGWEIASDPSASTAARVLSLRLLLAHVDSSSASYADLVGAATGDMCLGGMKQPLYRGNLSSTAADEIKLRVASLENDNAQPAEIRSAANCVMNAWRMQKGLSTQPVTSLSGTAFSLTFVCGNRFRVHNSLAETVNLTYAGQGETPKPLSAASGDMIIDVGSTSSVSLLLDGQVIQTVNKGTTRCY